MVTAFLISLCDLFRYPPTLSALQDMFDHAHLPGGLLQTSETVSTELDRGACLIIDDFHQYCVPLIQVSEIVFVTWCSCADVYCKVNQWSTYFNYGQAFYSY